MTRPAPIPTFLAPLVGLIGLGVVGAAAVAQTPAAEPSLDIDALSEIQRRPRAEVTLGIWFPRLEGLVTLGVGGTELDAGDDLSLDDSDTIFNGEFQVEWDRWQVLVGGYSVNTGGDAALGRDAIVRGSFVPAGTAVTSRVRAWSIDAEASWALFTPFRERRTPWSDRESPPGDHRAIDLVLQAVGGVRVVNLDQQYDFETIGLVGSDRAWFIPWLGVGCEVDWSTRRSIGVLDRLVFDVTAGWGPAISGGDSSFTVRADLTTYITRNLGVTLGYRLNDWDLSRDDDTFDGGLQGLYAGVRLAW